MLTKTQLNCCTAKTAKSAVMLAVLFFEKLCQKLYQSNLSKPNGKCRICHEAQFLNSLSLFHNKTHDSHIIIQYPALTGDKIYPLFADKLDNYLCGLYQMILSVTLVEEFPRRRSQLIIKTEVPQRIIQSDRRTPWCLFNQTKSIFSSLLGDRRDRELKQKNRLKQTRKQINRKSKLKSQLCCSLRNKFFTCTIEIHWNFFQEVPLYLFLFFLQCFVCFLS